MKGGKKTKITVSLDKELLKWVDERIREKKFGSRSHAVEYALYRLMRSEEG